MSNPYARRHIEEIRKLSKPEHVVQVLIREGDSLYKIAKDSGLSWPTIKKASRYGGFGYNPKTKKALKKLLQPVA